MIFWRKKNNATEQEQEEKEDKLLHRPDEPELEPPVEYDSDLSTEQEEELAEETEAEIIEDMHTIPAPEHNKLDDAREASEEREHDQEEESAGWFGRLTKGLSKSSGKIGQGISDLITKKKLDQAMVDQLEDVLISADIGPKTSADIVGVFSKDRFGKDITEDEIKDTLAFSIAEILEPVAQPLTFEKPANGGPMVILAVGVNGVGKTTTIGKLAFDLHIKQHKQVMIAAGDTFRAAAVEQLEEWAKRAHCQFVKKDVGADAAAVAYEAYEKARAVNSDILFIDTAGRLHNKSNLMAELEKIIRVLKKHDESLPHAVMLVLDATTGQNAFAQVETFKEMVDVSGLVVTKLDGSAKGGVVVGLADQFKLPIYAVGVGEKAEDLQPFHPMEFARSLVGLTD